MWSRSEVIAENSISQCCLLLSAKVVLKATHAACAQMYSYALFSVAKDFFFAKYSSKLMKSCLIPTLLIIFEGFSSHCTVL